MSISKIEGLVRTVHRNPACVARALQPDNLQQMVTLAEGNYVRTEIRSERVRSVIASMDDYLMNLSIAEALCSFVSD